MPEWRPRILAGPAPLHERIAAAMAADIAAGSLLAGARLPTHRELAHAVGVGLGSVTRAYALAMQRGLIQAQVGRGSFVADPSVTKDGDNRGGGRIDMAHNIPPIEGAERRFAEALGRLRRRSDLLDHLNYAPPAGFETHRRAAAAWLRRTANFDRSEWRRLLVTSGAQEAMAVVLGTIAHPGETVMVEAATFFGVRSLCSQTGLKLRALVMDEQGIVPDSLDEVARTGGRILYTMPTLQNPTGRIMGAARRAQIAEIVRRHELWIVEDDIYSAFADGQQPEPLAALIPERTFYVSGLSKALSPGLRVGFICAPSDDAFHRMITTIQARSFAPATLGALVATDWIESGAADEIVQDVRAEVRARTALGKDVFADALDPATGAQCPHLWLPMQELEAERLANRAIRAGIDVTPPSAPVIDRSMIYGVRVCIGAVRDRGVLHRSLGAIAGFLSDGDLGRDQGIV